jgi:hypothetical protein
MKQKQWVVLYSLALLAGIGLLVYQYAWRDQGPIVLPTVEGCRLHLEPCTASLPTGGSMIFEINPKNPAPTDILRLDAQFEQVEPNAVGVRFKGVNMKMGYLEHYVYPLQRNDALSASVLFEGEAGVFACSSNLMQWLVLVRVQVGDTRYEVPFEFETLQQGASGQGIGTGSGST